MKRLLINFSSGRIVLILFILTNLVYVLMVGYTIPQTLLHVPDMKLPDMMPGGYDPGYIQQLFTELGESGRKYYLNTQLPVDMIYPGLFALCYSLLLVYLLKKLRRQDTLLFLGAYLPLIAGAADYAENIGFIRLLKQFPHINETTVQLSSIFSVIKSVSTSIYFVLLLLALLWLLVVWIRKK